MLDRKEIDLGVTIEESIKKSKLKRFEISPHFVMVSEQRERNKAAAFHPEDSQGDGGPGLKDFAGRALIKFLDSQTIRRLAGLIKLPYLRNGIFDQNLVRSPKLVK